MTLEQVLIEHGYPVPPYAVGKLVRFAAPNKPKSNQSAWLRVFENGCAVFGNWITGEQHTYHPNQSLIISQSERSRLQKEVQAERKRFEKVELEKYQRASEQACQIVESATPAPATHAYLKRKQIDPHGVLFGSVLSYQDALIIPVYGTQAPFIGEYQSLQFIQPGGQKRFLAGGKKAGGYYPIQWVQDAPIVICEGFATGATLAQHYTPYSSVICAFDAGNLLSVAKSFRQQYPLAEIIIAGDNDHQTERNTGINTGKQKALFTANAIQAGLFIPEFAEHEQGSDWNDRHLLDLDNGLGGAE